jgi:hypothetical protein
VPLKIGKNRVEVETEDITGRSKSIDRMVTRAAPAPSLEPSTGELWDP